MAGATLDRFIEISPGIGDGKPHIAGHRITVQNIAIWHERMGFSPDQIANDYDLSLAEVYAALAYYFDHREEIEKSIGDGQALAESMHQANPSLVQRRLRDYPQQEAMR